MNDKILFRKIKFPSQIIQFVCLIQLITSSRTLTINDLKCVCDIRNGTTSEVTINTLPPFCTAASTSQNNEDDVKKMAYLKSKTPFIMYFNGFSYEEWETYLSYEKQFSFYIKEHNLDGIIFDKMYRGTKFDSARNQAISTFFKKLKQLNPHALFGLALPKDADVLPYIFDYSFLDPVVDFYVIQTINYRTCKYRISMKRTSTIGDMRKSLDAIKQTMPNMGKVLLTVQVYSIGITSDAKNGPTLITYSDMCHYKDKKLSKNRKYCKDSLETLWKKGKLVNDYQMLGVYIQYIDYDDFAGSCGCKITDSNTKQFPATATIISGTTANPTSNPEVCSNFGDYQETGGSSSTPDD